MSHSNFPRVRRNSVGLCVIAWMIVCAGSSAGQQSGLRDRDKAAARARTQAVLRDRNRETMHPGDPLTIVGLEQGGHDLRSHTPALMQTDHVVAPVDPEEMHQRAIAMYEDRIAFDQPPRRIFEPIAPTLGDSRAGKDATPVQAETGNSGSHGLWLVGLGLFTAMAVWLHMRFGFPFLKRPTGAV